MMGLIAAIAIANSIIIAAPNQDQNRLGDIIRPITASSSMALAIIVVYRQGVHGIFGRAFASLAVGITLWTIAELIWAYNSVVLGTDVPFPSIADVLWLTGYAPLGFHLFSTSRFYGVGLRKKSSFAVVLAVAIFSSAYAYSLISVSKLTGPDTSTSLAITIAYPLLDAIIVVPAVLSVLNSGKGELTAIPWIFIAWVMTTIADAIFGYTIVTNTAGSTQICTLIYNVAYLFMAAGLYWHNKYFIVGNRKFDEMWKETNR